MAFLFLRSATERDSIVADEKLTAAQREKELQVLVQNSHCVLQHSMWKLRIRKLQREGAGDDLVRGKCSQL